jgi:GT2 family glycosyltransferase
VNRSESDHAMSETGVTVVIVTWNGRAHLEACLGSLEKQTDRDFETIVVDNGSTDGTVEMLARDFPWARVLATGQNLGFAEGNNRGFAEARAAWIATLNNDTQADPHWLEALRKAALAAPQDVGMLQSRLVFKQHRDRTNSTGVLLFANGSAEDRDFDQPFRDGDREEEVLCPTAGAALYRRSMLDAIALQTGVFDRDFFMYYEDVDLGWRARLAGHRAIYVPEAIVAHEFQGSSKKRKNHFISMHLKRNRIRMLLKNGSWRFVLRALPKTLYDLSEAVLWFGPKALFDLVRAARSGLRARREVNAILVVKRRELELRWVSRNAR